MSSERRGLLLSSFMEDISEEQILHEVERIANDLELTNKYIFLFEEVGNENAKILTYNAVVSHGQIKNTSQFFTMRIHRKKQTNTLYTINALNLAIAQDNGGQVDKKFKLDWEKYRSSIMLSTQGQLDVRELRVIKIFRIE